MASCALRPTYLPTCTYKLSTCHPKGWRQVESWQVLCPDAGKLPASFAASWQVHSLAGSRGNQTYSRLKPIEPSTSRVFKCLFRRDHSVLRTFPPDFPSGKFSESSHSLAISVACKAF